MADLLLSDVHLRGLSDPRQRRLVALLERQRWERVFILGDLFHFWWGRGSLVEAGFVPTLACLHRLHQEGTRVVFIPGNHDFAVGDGLQELGVEVLTELRVLIGGRSTLLLHGDEADRSWGYRVASGVLRGRAFAGLMAGLGPQVSTRLGRALAADHAGEGNLRVLEAQQHLARELLKAGDLSLVVMGHSHTPGLFELLGGHLLNLGDLAHSGTYAVASDAGVQLWRGAGDGGADVRLATGGDGERFGGLGTKGAQAGAGLGVEAHVSAAAAAAGRPQAAAPWLPAP